RVLAIHRVDDPGASELYLRWWFLAGKRFLGADAAHADVRLTQLPVEASQRVPTAHEPLLRVDDVPDNRRPKRRMRVGTRTTARDWQWVNQAMEEDGEVDVAPQRGWQRRTGHDGGGGHEVAGGQDGGHGEPSGGSVPRTPGASTQGYVDETQQFFGSPGESFFDGVLSPASLEQQFGVTSGCMRGILEPGASRTPVDLNEPASDPFVDFSFALGGTPLSAFVDVPTHMDADDQAPPTAEDPETRRGRRAIRRRGCAFVDVSTHMDADDQAPPTAEDPEPRRGRRAIRRRGC
ncbi:hypothetical protein PIB30_109556, partial [Stylosanthes scabra]|nr:hypothetical protein [Stylosanthes scabra]